MPNSASASARVPDLVRQLLSLVNELERLFPDRRFTLDGHLVGSLGEVVAAERYGLALLPASSETHDARAADGRLAQIKLTQGGSVGLRSEPDHLLVLVLDEHAEVREVYNGPGAPAWAAAGRMQKNGQRSVAVAKLRSLMGSVTPSARLPAVV